MPLQSHTIHAQIVVSTTQVPRSHLVEAVCRHLEAKGYKIARPLIYPEEPMIIEITEEIPTFEY